MNCLVVQLTNMCALYVCLYICIAQVCSSIHIDSQPSVCKYTYVHTCMYTYVSTYIIKPSIYFTIQCQIINSVCVLLKNEFWFRKNLFGCSVEVCTTYRCNLKDPFLKHNLLRKSVYPVTSSSSTARIFCDNDFSKCNPACCCHSCCRRYANDGRTLEIVKRICNKIFKNYNRQMCQESFTVFGGGNSMFKSEKSPKG